MAKSKAPARKTPAPSKNPGATMITGQRGPIIQEVRRRCEDAARPDHDACKTNVDNLNQILADTITLRDMYKKHHWQVTGHTFYTLHLLFDKHADELTELIDSIAERIQILGGVSIAMAADVAK